MTVGKTHAQGQRDYLDPLPVQRVRKFTDLRPTMLQEMTSVIRCHQPSSFTPNSWQAIFTSNQTRTSNIYFTDWN